MYFQFRGFQSLIHLIAVSTLRFLVSRFHFLAERLAVEDQQRLSSF